MDSSGVVQGSQAAAAGLEEVAKAQKDATQSNREAGNAATATAKAERDLAAATEKVNATIYGQAAAFNKSTAALSSQKVALDSANLSADQSARVQKVFGGALNGTTVSAGSARAGMAQLGQQLQDVGIQAQAGTSFFTIFAQQTGQVGTALALMGGKLGAVGTFLAGPWGAALTIGTAILGPFIARLLSSGDAAADAAKKTDQYTDSIKRLLSAQGKATEIDVGNAQAKLFTLQGQLNNLNRQTGGNRGGAIDRAQQRAALQSQIDETNVAVESGKKRLATQQKLIEVGRQEKADNKSASAARVAQNKAERASETAANKAKREAEAATKKLATELDGLEAKYDKANGGAKAYLQTLEEIAKLVANGRITEGEAFNLRLKAGADKREADDKRRSAGFDDLVGYKIGGSDDPIKAVGIDAEKIIKEMDRRRDYGIDEEAKKAADALKQGAYDVSQILGNGQLGKSLGGLLQNLGLKGTDPSKNLAGQIKKLGDNILGPELSGKIGASVGKAFNGAAGGQFASSIAGSLGLKQSKTGAAVGGAIGSFLPIPGGEFIGGLIGGTIGGLFKKTKFGSATLGVNSEGKAGVTSTAGNSKSSIEGSTGAGGSVVSTLENIIGQLGGTLGQFAVSIGVRKGEYRVDSSGTGKTKGSTVEDFYDDQQGAILAAVADAIADGAIKNLSPAVTRALKSNKDVEKAVSDALGVQQIERLLAGLGGELNDIFFAEKRTADERLRLAKKYGLDVAAVEKLNAEEREKIIADTLSSRTGSLKSLLDNLKFGDLAEGDAFQKRQATLVEIAKAQKDAEAGVEGAADKLADLQRQLVEFSRDAFGTAGSEFSGDRANAISSAEKVIQLENDRIKAAADQQKTQTDALTNQNALTNEGNDLLSQQIVTMKQILEVLSSGSLNGVSIRDAAIASRQPAVAY